MTSAALTTAPTASRMTRWRTLSWICGASSLTAGILYIAAQFRLLGHMEDPFFVAIILFNTSIAIGFGFYFERKLTRMLTAFNETDPAEVIPPDQAITNIFDHPYAIPAALLFTAAIAGWVHLLAPWGDHTLDDGIASRLNAYLTLFLFCANFIIGCGLYCITRFWLLSAQRIKRVELNILVPTRPDLALFREIIRDLVILIAVIATLAVLSLPLSQIKVGVTTVLFSLSALAIVIASYLIPMLPMTKKFQQTKNRELHRVERRINAIYQDMIAKDDPTTQKAQLEAYAALRDQLKAVKTLPPGGEFSIVTSATVTFMTFLPSIIEWTRSLVSPF